MAAMSGDAVHLERRAFQAREQTTRKSHRAMKEKDGRKHLQAPELFRLP